MMVVPKQENDIPLIHFRLRFPGSSGPDPEHGLAFYLRKIVGDDQPRSTNSLDLSPQYEALVSEYSHQSALLGLGEPAVTLQNLFGPFSPLVAPESGTDRNSRTLGHLPTDCPSGEAGDAGFE